MGLGAWSYEISRAEEEPQQAAFLLSTRPCYEKFMPAAHAVVLGPEMPLRNLPQQLRPVHRAQAADDRPGRGRWLGIVLRRRAGSSRWEAEGGWDSCPRCVSSKAAGVAPCRWRGVALAFRFSMSCGGVTDPHGWYIGKKVGEVPWVHDPIAHVAPLFDFVD